MTILAPIDLAGSRGIILQTTGVPGINKIRFKTNQSYSFFSTSSSNLFVIVIVDRLSLEKDGSEIIIDRKDLILVTDQDLKEKPFKRIFIERNDDDHNDNNNDEYDENETNSKRKKSKNNDSSDEDNKKKHKKKSHKRDRNEKSNDSYRSNGRDSHENHDENNRSKKSKHDKESNLNSNSNSSQIASSSSTSSSLSWLRQNIRVKIITKKELSNRGNYYLSKGTVVDIYYPSKSTNTSKQATIRLDNGVILQDVSEKYLETVLPKKKGDQCMILTGEYCGSIGNLIELDYDRNKVTLQLEDDDMEILLLSMDSVAAIN